MKYLYYRDRKRRFKFFINELKLRLIKVICVNQNISLDFRREIFKHTTRMFKYSTCVVARDRCLINNSGRSVNRMLRLNRSSIREMCMSTDIIGMRRVVW